MEEYSSVTQYCITSYQIYPINIPHQLLKNKRYYVLYSTIKFISLFCQGEKVGKTNERSGRSEVAHQPNPKNDY